jgi:hypothetical protein
MLAAEVLDALVAAGVEFAVLHNEEETAAGEVTSDLDLVVAQEPRTVLSLARSWLERVGVCPVVLWDYDVGHTSTVFLATADASEGVQLDLMYDPMGHGKYGARTDRMLETRVDGVRWPTVGSLHRLAYLMRKRHVKQDEERLTALIAEARFLPTLEMETAFLETFSPKIARSLVQIASGMASRAVPYPRGYRIRDVARRVGRIRKAAGFWVEIEGGPSPDLLNAVADRFGRFLPVTGASLRPSAFWAEVEWWRAEVAPVRWRAGLFASDGADWPRGDLRVAPSDDLDVLCVQIVAAMDQRVTG